jgi:hypothetical protein
VSNTGSAGVLEEGLGRVEGGSREGRGRDRGIVEGGSWGVEGGGRVEGGLRGGSMEGRGRREDRGRVKGGSKEHK